MLSFQLPFGFDSSAFGLFYGCAREEIGHDHSGNSPEQSRQGILGPVLVNYIREYQIDRGVPAGQAYNVTMYVLAGLLVLGFFCNLAVRPVAERYYMSDEELAQERGSLATAGRH